MRQAGMAVLSAATLLVMGAGAVFAAPPTITIIDVSSEEYETDTEDGVSDHCGFPIDFEATGHIIVHEFNGNPRLVEIDNFRLFETFSANGKTVVVQPDSGPDRLWVGSDGDLYLAIVGRSVTGSGVIGRTVVNLSEFELVSSHGRDLGDFFAFLCSELAAPDPAP